MPLTQHEFGRVMDQINGNDDWARANNLAQVYHQRRAFWRAWKIAALLALIAGAIGGAIWHG